MHPPSQSGPFRALFVLNISTLITKVRKSFAYLRKNSLVEDVIPFDKSGKRGIIQGA
jgi:hypothetical protein